MNSYVVGPPQLSQPGPLAQAFSLPALDQAAEYLLASNPSTFDSVSAAALYLDSLRTPLPATSTSSTGFASDYDASLAFSYAIAEANDIRLDETRRFLVVGWTPPYKGHSIFADGDTSPTGAVVRALITTCVIQTGIPCVFIVRLPFATPLSSHADTLSISAGRRALCPVARDPRGLALVRSRPAQRLELASRAQGDALVQEVLLRCVPLAIETSAAC